MARKPPGPEVAMRQLNNLDNTVEAKNLKCPPLKAGVEGEVTAYAMLEKGAECFQLKFSIRFSMIEEDTGRERVEFFKFVTEEQYYDLQDLGHWTVPLHFLVEDANTPEDARTAIGVSASLNAIVAELVKLDLMVGEIDGNGGFLALEVSGLRSTALAFAEVTSDQLWWLDIDCVRESSVYRD